MTLTGAPSADGTTHVLVDVFRSVLGHAGLKGDAAGTVLDEMMAARRAAPPGECTLTFISRAGELEIALSQAGHSWRTTCPMPIR
jgi:hypothetical protein